MTQKTSYINISKVLFATAIFAIWFAATFDPIGKLFGIRYIALIGVMCLLGISGLYINIFKNLFTFTGGMIVYISFLMPLYGFSLYCLRGGYTTPLLDTSYVSSGVLLLISYLYKNKKMCELGITSMVTMLRLLVFFTTALFIFNILGQDPGWRAFLIEHDIAIIGFREWAGIQFPYIYFVASPMLIFLIGYDLNRLKMHFGMIQLFLCFTSVLAFGLSGTRAHIIIATVFPFIYFLIEGKNKNIIKFALGIIFIITMVYLFSTSIFNSFFASNETNNSMKIGMLPGYQTIFSNPINLVFGQGYNAHAWSPELRKMISMEISASKTELTYLELFRVYGLLCGLPSIIFIVMLLHKINRLPNSHRWLFISTVIYFLNCVLNPYLFSSNGMIPLALILALIRTNKQEERNSYTTALTSYLPHPSVDSEH